MDGNYSVRSGYRETLAAKDHSEALNPKENKAWLKFIRNLNVPHKVKLFV